MTVSDIANARLDKLTDNADIRPADLLRAILNEIECGEIRADAAYVVIVEGKGGDNEYHHRFRANLTWEAENLMLDLAKKNLLHSYSGEV